MKIYILNCKFSSHITLVYKYFSESKSIPQQGLQLFVEFPDSVRKKAKTIDVEMMMKRKINRVKKECQIYMHKVHVLCWLGHGNYISRILNDEELMAAALLLIPSKDSYPEERVDVKYVEQITTWYKDKLSFKQDKNEDKFRPKAPPLKEILLGQIEKRVVTTKKYLVFIFVAMLRALGLQCRVMFNFVTLPIKPSSAELCSLSMKKDLTKSGNKSNLSTIKEETSKGKSKKGTGFKKADKKTTLTQVDGTYDCDIRNDSDWSEIMQLDGNDDLPSKCRSLRSAKTRKLLSTETANDEVSPSKISRKSESIENNEQMKSTRTRKLHGNKEQLIIDHQNNKTKSTRITKSSRLEPNVITNIQDLSLTDLSKNHTSKEKINTKISNKKLQTNKNIKPKTATVEQNRNKTLGVNESKIHDVSMKSKFEAEATGSNNEKRTKKHKPDIIVTNENEVVSSKFFDGVIASSTRMTRKRSQSSKLQDDKLKNSNANPNTRTKSAPDTEESKYFESNIKRPSVNNVDTKKECSQVDKRISHRDLSEKKPKARNDVTKDLMNIIKNRIKDAKSDSKKGTVKGTFLINVTFDIYYCADLLNKSK